VSKRAGVEGAVDDAGELAGGVAFLVDFHDGGDLELAGEEAELAGAGGAVSGDAGDRHIIEGGGEIGGHGEELGFCFAEGFEVGFESGEGLGVLVHDGGRVSKGRI